MRLTASVALGQKLVLPLLEKLHRVHPGLQLELRFSDLVVDLVGQQVVAALRQSPSVDESLIGIRLGTLRFRVCASPRYITQHGRPELPADLSHRDCARIALPGFSSAWSFRQRAERMATWTSCPSVAG